MDKDAFYEIFGFKLAVMALGFCGGVLSLAYVKTLTISWAFFAVIAGTVCAVTITPIIQTLWAFPPSCENGIAFILGIGGLSLVGKIHDAFIRLSIKAALSKKLDILEQEDKK